MTTPVNTLHTLRDTLVNPLNSLTSNLGSDAHFFDESIHPETVKQYLSSSNTGAVLSATAASSLLKGMKWLLAMMSKGRNVSNFMPEVVKLVQCPNIEIKKMALLYLVEYADSCAECREMALLSINSFQRGLAESEQMIRALSLRVLTQIRVPDILPIQVLAVRKCVSDVSPYVRKCAVNALGKVYVQCEMEDVKNELLKLLESVLNKEVSTMVLSSSMTTFIEVAPHSLHLIHKSYRKLCHLLTDMDEWGQIICLDVLGRYCRENFTKPDPGDAEMIDQQRRRVRYENSGSYSSIPDAAVSTGSATQQQQSIPTKVKRRVIKKGFYSDDDESTEEEVVEHKTNISVPISNQGPVYVDDDHELLLKSSFQLLKSRNSGVVLAVALLHFNCGISDISTRSAIGKALVRIHRENSEVQYVVLSVIKDLAVICPSAFTPYLPDFYVSALDPSFTRLLKLEILVLLALEPNLVEAVLNEVKEYLRYEDKVFVCACVDAVVRVARSSFHGLDPEIASNIIYSCLRGLLTLSSSVASDVVIGQSIVAIASIFELCHFSKNANSLRDDSAMKKLAVRRVLSYLVKSLLPTESLEGEEEKKTDEAERKTIPTKAVAAGLWVLGEWAVGGTMTTSPKISVGLNEQSVIENLLRLLARSFTSVEKEVKLQAIHLSSKLILYQGNEVGTNIREISEYILALGRNDVLTDVRDRARFESNVLNLSIGISGASLEDAATKKITVDQARVIFQSRKPTSNTLPFMLSEDKAPRLGTLSSLVGHCAGSTYFKLPAWAHKVSSDALRQPVEESIVGNEGGVPIGSNGNGFYSSSDSSSDDSSSSESDGSEDSDYESSSDEESSSSEELSGSDSDGQDDFPTNHTMISSLSNPSRHVYPNHTNNTGSNMDVFSTLTSDGESSSSDESESSDDEAVEVKHTQPTMNVATGGLISMMEPQISPPPASEHKSNLQEDDSSELTGLVMAPLVTDENEILNSNPEIESSSWFAVLRPEFGGGLCLEGRYLRGGSRLKELKTLNLPLKTDAVVLQFKFTNKRSDRLICRRVRLVHRSGNVEQLYLGSEIPAIGPNQASLISVVMVFGRFSSDRDGDCNVHLDVKYSAETYSVLIKPPLAELIQPVSLASDEFNTAISKLTGFQQMHVALSELPNQPADVLCKHMNIKTVGGVEDGIICFASRLPSSGTLAYVRINVTEKQLCLYSENAMILNSFIETVKAFLK